MEYSAVTSQAEAVQKCSSTFRPTIDNVANIASKPIDGLRAAAIFTPALFTFRLVLSVQERPSDWSNGLLCVLVGRRGRIPRARTNPFLPLTGPLFAESLTVIPDRRDVKVVIII